MRRALRLRSPLLKLTFNIGKNERSILLGKLPKTVTIRKLALWLHRYVGLAMAVFLVIGGLTGSLLAFHEELDGAFNRSAYYVEPSADAPLDPLVLRERLLEKLPAGTVMDNVSLNQEPGESTSLFVRLPKGAAGLDDQYFMHPTTGEILGSRRWADLSQGITNFMPFVYVLHDNLALGEVGSVLFGIVALLWTIDCFVGAYLTFPVRGPRSTRVGREGAPEAAGTKLHVFFARWGRAWLLKTKKLLSLVFTWHRASGLWVWGMLLVFAWSGVALSLYPVYHTVTKAVFEMPKDSVYDRLPHLGEPKLEPVMSFGAARRRGQFLMEEEARRRGFAIIREDRLRYHPDSGYFQYRIRSNLDVTRRYPQTSVWFHGDTGKLLGLELPNSHSGTLVTNWLYALHWGSWTAGGLGYRVFVCVFGLVVTALSVSGVWIWWAKRRK